MNKRIIKKWKSENRYDEMLKKHIARIGGPFQNSNPNNWPAKSYYFGEKGLRDFYWEIKKMDPLNPVLKYCRLDKKNHLEILSAFIEEKWPGQNMEPEEYHINVATRLNGGKIPPFVYSGTVVLTLQTELSKQYKFLRKLKSAEEQETKNIEKLLIE